MIRSTKLMKSSNDTIVTGQLGEVQGYLVYSFFVVNGENNMGFLTIVDAGSGGTQNVSRTLCTTRC